MASCYVFKRIELPVDYSCNDYNYIFGPKSHELHGGEMQRTFRVKEDNQSKPSNLSTLSVCTKRR